jgi:hypothetical protein
MIRVEINLKAKMPRLGKIIKRVTANQGLKMSMLFETIPAVTKHNLNIHSQR